MRPIVASPTSRSPFALAERWRWPEIAFWAVVASAPLYAADHLVLAAQIVIAGLFALSLDLLLGYGGIVSLGHAAFFGFGAYAAGLAATHGWREPLSGLVIAGAAAGLLGFVTSFVVARVRGIALLMVTMGIALVLHELAQKAHDLTGGDDGLQGIDVAPLFGIFDFDLYGRTAFAYVAIVAFLLFLLVRRLVHSPFGLALGGMRENARRMPAIGASLRRHAALVFTQAAVLAGIAGGLLAQTTQFVAVDIFDLQRSAEILIMLILGGAGRLYGGFIGAAVFLLLRDRLAAASPQYWFFWLGLLLVCLVLFARGGILGGLAALRLRLARRRRLAAAP
jgi:branched-chain amino acid transport system permease protein